MLLGAAELVEGHWPRCGLQVGAGGLLSGCNCGPYEAWNVRRQETQGSSLCCHLAGEEKNILPILENGKKNFCFNHGKQHNRSNSKPQNKVT